MEYKSQNFRHHKSSPSKSFKSEFNSWCKSPLKRLLRFEHSPRTARRKPTERRTKSTRKKRKRKSNRFGSKPLVPLRNARHARSIELRRASSPATGNRAIGSDAVDCALFICICASRPGKRSSTPRARRFELESRCAAQRASDSSSGAGSGEFAESRWGTRRLASATRQVRDNGCERRRR
ncbi:hypothetical protein NL676_032346 [Syzygium grande]|nr:hypothetical protein NL676_032346 [Syzygium grande]